MIDRRRIFPHSQSAFGDHERLGQSSTKGTSARPFSLCHGVKVRSRRWRPLLLSLRERLHLDLPCLARRSGRRQARISSMCCTCRMQLSTIRRMNMKKEDAKQLADQAITALQEELKAGRSESLLRYLDSMSRFHSYSWTNSLLIVLQNPEATLVAGFQRWLQHGTTCPKRRKRNRDHGTARLSQSL